MIMAKYFIQNLRSCSSFSRFILKDHGHVEYKQIRFITASTYRLLNDYGDDKRSEKFDQIIIMGSYFEREKRDKTTFIAILEAFKKKKHKVGLVEFITVAGRRMKDYGVHEDLEVYKLLIDMFPKGPMVATNPLLVAYDFHPKHQLCVIELLDAMNLNRIIPDSETYDILVATFGRNSKPVAKYLRMIYWGPKFKNLNPWPNPDPRPKNDEETAIMAIDRICSVDLEHETDKFHSMEDENSLEDTWIISGQSPIQKKLIHYHPQDVPMYVEGPFIQYVGLKDRAEYFVLKSDMPKTRRRCTPKDPDVIKNLKIPFLDPPTSEDLIPDFSVHEQKKEIIYAIGTTGTKTLESLLSWIRILQKHGNPRLKDIPIVFRLNKGKTDESERLKIEAC